MFALLLIVQDNLRRDKTWHCVAPSPRLPVCSRRNAERLAVPHLFFHAWRVADMNTHKEPSGQSVWRKQQMTLEKRDSRRRRMQGNEYAKHFMKAPQKTEHLHSDKLTDKQRSQTHQLCWVMNVPLSSAVGAAGAFNSNSVQSVWNTVGWTKKQEVGSIFVAVFVLYDGKSHFEVTAYLLDSKRLLTNASSRTIYQVLPSVGFMLSLSACDSTRKLHCVVQRVLLWQKRCRCCNAAANRTKIARTHEAQHAILQGCWKFVRVTFKTTK